MELDTDSNEKPINVSLIVSLFVVHTTTNVNNVQVGRDNICYSNFDAKRFSSQICSIQENHDTASSIVHNRCKNN